MPLCENCGEEIDTWGSYCDDRCAREAGEDIPQKPRYLSKRDEARALKAIVDECAV